MDNRKNKIMPTHNKKITKDSRGYGLKQIAKMTLGSGNIDLAVELPKGEDLNEWLAVNTIEFYNDINLLYGMLVEFCTKESCPVMSAGPKYEYLWADGSNVKTPMKVSAGEYIEFLMVWVENQINNANYFPVCSFLLSLNFCIRSERGANSFGSTKLNLSIKKIKCLKHVFK